MAYFRIPYTSGDLQEPDPKWYTFKAVKTKEAEGRGVTHSFILANFMLRPEN